MLPSFLGHSTNFLANQRRAVAVGEAVKQTHAQHFWEVFHCFPPRKAREGFTARSLCFLFPGTENQLRPIAISETHVPQQHSG